MEEKITEVPGTYDSLELLYTNCAGKGIAEALENVWKGSQEYEKFGGSFGVLVDKDKKNTQKQLKSGKVVNDITADAASYGDLDIQACNKIIVFLEVPRKKIFSYFDLDNNQWEKCVENCKEMNSKRNKYYHKTPNVTPEERRKGLMTLVQLMEQTIGMLYSNIKDENGDLYLTRFKQERMLYEAEQLKQKHYLSDHLDLSKYDASKFFTVCANLGIKDPGKEDGRLYFYSSDLKKDLELLKNELTLHDEEKVPPASVQKAGPVEVIIKNWQKYLIPAVLVLALLIGGAVLSTIGKIGSAAEDNDVPDMGELMDNAQSMLDNAMGNVPAGTADPNQKNQIPAQFENDVLVLQSSDDLKLSNLTLEVEVGKTIAPPAAGTWKSGVTYSQNTEIAKPEGQVVRGIAPGETYIVYAKGTMSAAYRVIVSEPEATVAPDSKNQIPPKYNQDLQLLQIATPQQQKLMTLEVKVGEYTAPREAATWRNGVIYSQNTDVAMPEGLIVHGVAVGETYIIYESNGLVSAYRILVTE